MQSSSLGKKNEAKFSLSSPPSHKLLLRAFLRAYRSLAERSPACYFTSQRQMQDLVEREKKRESVRERERERREKERKLEKNQFRRIQDMAAIKYRLVVFRRVSFPCPRINFAFFTFARILLKKPLWKK